MSTTLKRVDFRKRGATKKIKEECDKQERLGRKLAAAFTLDMQVVLVFQSTS